MESFCKYALLFSRLCKKRKKIAYAASFGNAAEDYTPEMIDCIRLLVSKFDAVSVREKKAIDIFRRFNWTLSYTPKCVLDPTLLLVKDDYLKILNQSSLKKIMIVIYFTIFLILIRKKIFCRKVFIQ